MFIRSCCRYRAGDEGRRGTFTYGPCMSAVYLHLAISLISGLTAVTGDVGYNLTTTKIYFAFTSPLEITYSIPKGVSIPDAFIRLVSLDGGETEITTMSVPMGIRTSTRRIGCGIVEYAGKYAFRMFMFRGGRMLAETTLEVRWPEMKLDLPSEHEALSRGIYITLTSSAKCNPVIHRYTFWIDLYYVGEDRNAAVRGLHKSERIDRKNISDIIKDKQTLHYPCSAIDLAGFYRAEIKSSFNGSSVIGKSNLMFVTWSEKYNLTIYSASVFPCQRSLSLFYKQPVCLGGKDNIRLYKLVRRVQGSLAAPIESLYIIERDATKEKGSLRYDCDLFAENAIGYCFIYVSMSKIGAVKEQRKYCIPTREDAVFAADGQWTAWSSWGQCSVTCGNGMKSRFRMCNNPPPMNGGDFCVGDPVTWTPCSAVCPELLSQLTPLYSIKLDEDCACGCTMGSTSGKIVATGRCLGLSVWLIRVDPVHKIKLSFAFFDLYENMQWVRIRNGGSRTADLLASSEGLRPLDDVISSSNEMLVEFMTETMTTPSTSLGLFLHEPTESIHVHGFIAYYNILDKNTTVAASHLTLITSPAWESAVTIGGVLVCVLIVVGTVLFVIYHQMQRRQRHKYKMAKTESPTSPSHINKGTSIQTPSSPDEMESPGVDMETPLTGELKRKEFPIGAGKSRGSSVSSTSSAGYKRLRTKADIQNGGSPVRSFSPLQSPYAANASVDDFKHDQNFFKGYRPRSPKIHPSPKAKRSPTSRSPATTPTKHSMLTKALIEKRRDEDEARVVTGASSTPTSKEQSGSASTSKTDEKVQNIPETSKQHRKREKTDGRDASVVRDKSRTDKSKAKDDSHSKSKANKKKSKSGVRTSTQNAVEMDVKHKTPDEENVKQTTEFMQSNPKPRRPTSLTDGYMVVEPAVVEIRPEKKERFKFMKKRQAPVENGTSAKMSTLDERQKCLPRPDGQSPESIREERIAASLASTPKSIKSLRSNRTLSPTKSCRSANTPSDTVELEYDDFIEDDPLSYFEYDEMLKLRWHGVEKIGKPAKEEDDDSVNVSGAGRH